MRVLLVEEDKDALATLAAVLRFEQYEVFTAPDAVTALEMARLYPPDVALLDLDLPRMDGYTLAKALRQQAPARKLYIAAITGTAGDKRLAAEAGIDAHLTKPSKPSELIEVLREFESKL